MSEQQVQNINPENTIKERHGLVPIICVAIVLITLVVAVAVSMINYQKYREAIMDIHENEAIGACKLMEATLTENDWAWLGEMGFKYLWDQVDEDTFLAIEDDDQYMQAKKLIQQMVDSLNLWNTSVFIIDENEMNTLDKDGFDLDNSYYMVFMMDFYPSGSEGSAYDIGAFGIWWSDQEGFIYYREMFNELIQSNEIRVLNETMDDGTPLITAYCPILSRNNVTAVAMVCQRVSDIDQFVGSFFLPTLLIGLGIAAVLIALAILFFMGRIAKPLRIVTKEASQFIRGNAVISEKLGKVHTRDEIQQLAESVLQMEKDVNKYVAEVQQAATEKERIRTELSVATRIQEDMLPRTFPPYPDRTDFSIFASMDPAKEVGGDFYDFFLIDENHIALVIADVAGKGVPASLFMVIAKTLIKTRTQLGGSPAEILHDVNTQLCDGNDENMFVTVWMAIIDLTTGKGIAANAGHEHPIRRDAGGEYHLVEYRHSPAVALFDTLKFREHEFELQPGDRIFVYTDGLPEATNAQDELYGTERVLQVLNKDAQLPMEEILPTVTEDVEKFVGEAPQFDDLTMLVFEYQGKQEQ